MVGDQFYAAYRTNLEAAQQCFRILAFCSTAAPSVLRGSYAGIQLHRLPSRPYPLDILAERDGPSAA
jgi:hypothetical protein